MDKFKKIRKIILIVLGGCFLAYIVYMFHLLNLETSKNPIRESDVSQNDYANMCNQEAREKLILNKSFSFKSRNDISLYYYDKIYALEITKINLVSNFDLLKDFNEIQSKSEVTGNIVYTPYYEKYFTVNYKLTSNDRVSKINLALDGDSVKTIEKTDSIICYNLKFRNFSIHFNKVGTNQIYAETNPIIGLTKTPISMLFLKKNNCLYFFLLTPNDANTKLNPDLLYKLISKE